MSQNVVLNRHCNKVFHFYLILDIWMCQFIFPQRYARDSSYIETWWITWSLLWSMILSKDIIYITAKKEEEKFEIIHIYTLEVTLWLTWLFSFLKNLSNIEIFILFECIGKVFFGLNLNLLGLSVRKCWFYVTVWVNELR